MKFKIAVTDACIFIDLYDLDLIATFFTLEVEINTNPQYIMSYIPSSNKFLRPISLLTDSLFIICRNKIL